MKTVNNQDEVRRANDSRIIEALMNGPMTRRELQKAASLSWGGITNTVNRLIDAGYITEQRCQGSRCGRTPAMAALREDDNLIVGIDVNHTGLTGCVTALTGKILSEYSAEADFSSPAALIDSIESFVEATLSGLSGKHVLTLGVSMQGEVDVNSGISLRLPQCAGWQDVALRDILAKRFGLNVYIAHDPDCMLHAYLSSSGMQDAILMRLDSSVGLAVSVGGRLIQGAGLMEAAHMIIDPHGPECRCGMRGCLNAYVAACNKPEGYAALAGPLAVAIHNIVQLFRPKTVVFAGELMEHADMFMDKFRNIFAEISCHSGKVDIQTISHAQLAMRGAALIASECAVRALDIREEK